MQRQIELVGLHPSIVLSLQKDRGIELVLVELLLNLLVLVHQLVEVLLLVLSLLLRDTLVLLVDSFLQNLVQVLIFRGDHAVIDVLPLEVFVEVFRGA